MAETATLQVPIYPDLASKVAVVTGGSKGIGAATCRVLAANRAKVAVVARSKEGIDTEVASLRSRGAEAVGLEADCTKFSDLEVVRRSVERELGPVDVLIAFAGGFGALTPVQDISEDEWNFVVDSNLTSTFLTVKCFLPGMIERRRGAIVTMASNAGRFLDIPLTASYAAAKAAIVMFTRHVAKEVGTYGIRANCVAPATSLSERVGRIMSPERIEEIAAMAPLGRIGLPEDTALATLFLASESSGWITGVTLDIAGGRIML
jgi:3-oxoacyl-[acyl-carrier protein] reductase